MRSNCLRIMSRDMVKQRRMNRKTYRLVLLLAAAVAILMASAGVAMHRYPYTVRYVMAKLAPSRHFSYNSEDLNYLNTFNDRQDRQIKVARKVGLQEAPSTRSDIEGMLDQLEKVKNGRAYSLAPMSHSVPYLRPNAKAALDQIGIAFRDSLKSKGFPDYKIVVTSILRTKTDVERLQKTNSNADCCSRLSASRIFLHSACLSSIIRK